MSYVQGIIDDVRTKGDRAVEGYARQFDHFSRERFELNPGEIEAAVSVIEPNILLSLEYAIRNVRSFAGVQMAQCTGFEIETVHGILGQKVLPLQRVGCYVPGGRFPLVSTALMTIVPAKIAGVEEIVVCSPNIHPTVVVAAYLAGADRIFSVGGPWSIAAFAYGTEQIPRVDKIVGPGNKYVTEAKRLVSGDVGIDILAGPSELLIIADESTNESFVQADLAAQQEHASDARTRVFRVPSDGGIEEVISLANEMAPEHLSLQVADPERYVPFLRNYGSLFIGKESAVAFGDYCSGTNHVLPTGGTARFSSGLSVRDFLMFRTYQHIVPNAEMKEAARCLAELEGLTGHQKSIDLR